MDYRTCKHIMCNYLPTSDIGRKAFEFLKADNPQDAKYIEEEFFTVPGQLRKIEECVLDYYIRGAWVYKHSRSSYLTYDQGQKLIRVAKDQGLTVDQIINITDRICLDLYGNIAACRCAYIPRTAKWIAKSIDIVEDIFKALEIDYDITEDIDGVHIYERAGVNHASVF